MPMYEYRCVECGLLFEVRQKFSDAPVEECRDCGGKVEKLISRSDFALKGDGWFEQGYGSSGSVAKSAPPCATTGVCAK
ncbi:MAG: transcriptional regulator [Desulfobacteraceae bacterium 4572_35.1]|nr:MAG: transcriptional regulator [Desulfobacteraceae bacterium 4572_35.1]